MATKTDPLIDTVLAGRELRRDEMSRVLEDFIAGELSDDRLERFLVAMADRGETAEEIVGAATVMRRHVVHVDCGADDAIDTCGAGGDGISTFNVSTAAAIIAAGAGAKVAKHGNRTNSRKSGSAEVLAALGVDIDAPPTVVARCVREVGIGFLFAAHLHPAMKRAAPIRRKIGRRTIFNLLGPLVNPASVRRQVVGVPRPELLEKIAGVLRGLGTDRAFVVHGHDGLCDLTITGPSSYVELRDGKIAGHTVHPQDVGLAPAPLDALRIDSPEQSAAVILAILAGERGARRDHTLLNAAAALVVAGIADDLAAGVTLAAAAVDDGRATATLERLVTLTHEATDDAEEAS